MSSQSVSFLQAAILACILLLVQSGTVDIYNAPTFTTSDAFQFFYLESAFPYNTPQTIKNAAGSNFLKYGVSHAGLGVWDTTTNEKFSIEFVSNSYKGALLPNCTGGKILWQNAGSIVITNPLVENNWLNSRLIATTTANAWTQLVTYLKETDTIDRYVVYQPVSVVYANSSLYSNTTEVSTDDISSVGGVISYAVNSFYFVDDLIKQLADYGTDLGAFLQIYANSYDYLAKENIAPVVVSWDENGAANPQVYQWFKALGDCYTSVFETTEANGQGSAYFNEAVKTCYGTTAYVYRTASSVYNVTLQQATTTFPYSTPELTQYIYNLPPSSGPGNETLSILDDFMIAFAFLALIAGVVYFVRKFLGKKDRRRVSLEGEDLASRAVNNIVGLDEANDNDEMKTYYHGSKKAGIFGRWKSGNKSSSRSEGSVVASKRGSYQDEEKGRDSNSLEKPLTSAQCRLNKSAPEVTKDDAVPEESTV